MRLLWVKVNGLWPLDTGGRLRSFHIVSELTRRHRVTVLTTHAPGEDGAALAARLPHAARVRSVPHARAPHGTPALAWALARSWLSPLPVDLLKWRIPALQAEVRRILASGEIDLCVADFLFAAPNVPRDGRLPVVLFQHNVEHVIWKRLQAVETRRWRRALLGVEWRKIRRYEAEACRRAALTLAVSEEDRALLAAAAPGARLGVIPTGVDVEYFAPTGRGEEPASLVFTGSMDWYPNEDAVRHFCDAILPRIRARAPGCAVAIVGRRPPAAVRAAAARAGAHVTGTVDDVRPWVRRAAVYVVPLRIGGGTRLKIFEALAMGKAVVSTTVGAEGLPLVDGRHFVRADAPAAFADAVVALLRDPGRRAALGRAGRGLVEAGHAWPRVASEFETWCEQAMKEYGHAG